MTLGELIFGTSFNASLVVYIRDIYSHERVCVEAFENDDDIEEVGDIFGSVMIEEIDTSDEHEGAIVIRANTVDDTIGRLSAVKTKHCKVYPVGWYINM